MVTTQNRINRSTDEAKADVDSKTDSVRTRNAIIITVAILIAAAVIAFFVARNVAEPVGRLTAVADKISKGDIDVKIDNKSEDEIGDLVQSFERMVAAIRFLPQDEEKGGKQ